MIALGIVEGLEGHDLGHDRLAVRLVLGQLGHVRVGCRLLLGGAEEDRRAVLGAVVRPLPIQLGRIVGHLEEHLEQFPVRHHAGIVDHLHRLGVPGLTGAHLFIGRLHRGATGIAGHGAGHAPGVLEDGLNAPKTAPGEIGRIGLGRRDFRGRNRPGQQAKNNDQPTDG